jgi:hypothetical protein
MKNSCLLTKGASYSDTLPPDPLVTVSTGSRAPCEPPPLSIITHSVSKWGLLRFSGQLLRLKLFSASGSFASLVVYIAHRPAGNLATALLRRTCVPRVRKEAVQP